MSFNHPADAIDKAKPKIAEAKLLAEGAKRIFRELDRRIPTDCIEPPAIAEGWKRSSKRKETSGNPCSSIAKLGLGHNSFLELASPRPNKPAIILPSRIPPATPMVDSVILEISLAGCKLPKTPDVLGQIFIPNYFRMRPLVLRHRRTMRSALVEVSWAMEGAFHFRPPA